MGLHYAATLAEWRRRFYESSEAVSGLGFDDRFCRLWDYYLAYCEGAFRERHISDVQLMLTKTGNRSSLYGEPASSELPASRIVAYVARAGSQASGARRP